MIFPRESRCRALLLIFLYATLLVGARAAERWQLRGGGQVLVGDLVMVVDGKVVIEEADGRQWNVTYASLNERGRRMVDGWIKRQGGSVKFCSWLASPDSAFRGSWPRTVYGPASPSVRRITNKETQGRYVYESENYRFISDAKLDAGVVGKFCTVFETTYTYVLKLPLNAAAKYRREKDKFEVFVFGSQQAYLRAGGAQGAAGVYLPRTRQVLIPLRSLSVVPRGSEWVYDKDRANNVVAHELTHQLTDGVAFAPWYLEGSAEYVAITRYTHAAYHIYGNKPRFFKFVTEAEGFDGLRGRNLGRRFSLPKLEHFMGLNYQQFLRQEGNRNYGVAALLTYYFYHVDGAGDAKRIKGYIKTLQRGGSELQARQALLDGRSYAELQESFRKFCAQNGLALDFAK